MDYQRIPLIEGVDIILTVNDQPLPRDGVKQLTARTWAFRARSSQQVGFWLINDTSSVLGFPAVVEYPSGARSLIFQKYTRDVTELEQMGDSHFWEVRSGQQQHVAGFYDGAQIMPFEVVDQLTFEIGLKFPISYVAPQQEAVKTPVNSLVSGYQYRMGAFSVWESIKIIVHQADKG